MLKENSIPYSQLKIVSGGQTGADRAGLDVGLALGIAISGFIPKGRLAEDGPLSSKYPLIETRSTSYPLRTRKNVEEAELTLIFTMDAPLTGGSLLTVNHCKRVSKPFIRVVFSDSALREKLKLARKYLDDGIRVVNVAGSRASTAPEIYELTYDFLLEMFQLEGA